jgi:hypothetical protein
MSCGGGTPTFRLLDAFIGWDAGPNESLARNSKSQNLQG